MNEFMEKKVELNWPEPKQSYDVVIVGSGAGGGTLAAHLHHGQHQPSCG